MKNMLKMLLAVETLTTCVKLLASFATQNKTKKKSKAVYRMPK